MALADPQHLAIDRVQSQNRRDPVVEAAHKIVSSGSATETFERTGGSSNIRLMVLILDGSSEHVAHA